MVLTKNELIASLQHEVRVLLHLASKIDRSMLDYRPTPKQRSTLELLVHAQEHLADARLVASAQEDRHLLVPALEKPSWYDERRKGPRS